MSLNRSAAKVSVLFAVGGLFAAAPSHAASGNPQQTPVDAGITATSLGLGVQASALVTDNLAIRVGYNKYSYSHNGTSGSLDYNGSLDLQGTTVAADIYAGKHSSFHVSGGFIIDDNKLNANGKAGSSASYTINGNTYTAADIGSLNGSVKYGSFAPYLGIGWGKPSTKGGVQMTFDLGAMFQSGTKATLTPSDSTAELQENLGEGYAQFQSDLAAQQSKLKSDADKLNVYPIVNLGLVWSFG